jgi:Restriction endonuclease
LVSLLPRDARAVQAQFAAMRTEAERLAKAIEEGRQLLETMLGNRFAGIELLAEAWADYELARGEIDANDLIRKSHPAYQSADVVRAKSKELAAMRKRAKYLEQVVKLHEWHVPWLSELRDLEEEESYAKLASAEGEPTEDPVVGWLTREEYAALSPQERNQRALDRYWKAKKSKWQIGRDYERYVGYLYEAEGFEVTYYGIEKGLEDLGRDVIARKDHEIIVAQCKRWSSEKVIHEKHVFQLFGTVTAFQIDNSAAQVLGRFVTTTKLSERARAFADRLAILVDEGFAFDEAYPCIKCNVSTTNGERIYHLPFDQMYDATVVHPERGEFYARTVKEAEDAGFRRAFRWREEEPA